MARESRFALRLPAELYERVKTEAAQAGISMNEMIVKAVSHYFDIRLEYERRFTELESRLAALEGR